MDTQMVVMRMGDEFRDKEQGVSKWRAALVKHEAVNTQDIRKQPRSVWLYQSTTQKAKQWGLGGQAGFAHKNDPY